MKALSKILQDNVLFLLIGVIYYLSFSGITVGDLFFRNLENNYPLFLSSNWGIWPIWLGFDFAHLLNIPTLRGMQILLAFVGLRPNPLLFVQLVNLILALVTLKLFYSILRQLGVTRLLAQATTILYAFSFGFLTNLNAEICHFSVLFVALVFWLLLKIEKENYIDRKTIFLFCFSLTAAILFHFENMVFIVFVLLYLLLKRNLRDKFLSQMGVVILAAIVLPSLFIIGSFIFYFFESGHWLGPSMINRFQYEAKASVLGLMNFHPNNIYGMLRAYFESFSIISRRITLIVNFPIVKSYANPLLVSFSMIFLSVYIIVFSFVHVYATYFLGRNWRSVYDLVKLQLTAWAAYLSIFGLLVSKVFHISELFIVATMIYCLLLGYIHSYTNRFYRCIFYSFVVMTVFANIFWFVYPQKVSARSLNAIFDDVSFLKSDQKVAVFRLAFFDFPYETGFNPAVDQFVMDEHAYDSREKVYKQLALVKKYYQAKKKIYFIAPGFLFLKNNQADLAPLPLIMGKNPEIIKNCEFFLNTIKHHYRLSVSARYQYNWAALGDLGEIVLVKLH